jgi:hypothetical protein
MWKNLLHQFECYDIGNYKELGFKYVGKVNIHVRFKILELGV